MHDATIAYLAITVGILGGGFWTWVTARIVAWVPKQTLTGRRS